MWRLLPLWFRRWRTFRKVDRLRAKLEAQGYRVWRMPPESRLPIPEYDAFPEASEVEELLAEAEAYRHAIANLPEGVSRTVNEAALAVTTQRLSRLRPTS